jgi:hypothetical protein
MTIEKISEMIWDCVREDCAIDNNSQIYNTFKAIEELVATLQPTPINDLCLYKEAIVKGKICATYDSNYIEDGKEFKATMVELLIKHEE